VRPRSRLVFALVLPLLAAAACSRTQDLSVTDWFTVRQRFPKKVGDSFAVGPSQRQTYFTAVDGTWVSVGQGDLGRYLVLDGGEAVLFATSPAGDLLLLHRGEGGPKRVADLLPPGKPLSVSPDGRFLDVPRCEGRGVSGCVSLEVVRYDVRARKVSTQVVGLPQAQAGCDFPNLPPIGYDEEGDAYYAGRCEGFDPIGMLLSPKPDGLRVRQRPKPSQSLVSGQIDFWTPALGFTLREPARFTALPVALPE